MLSDYAVLRDQRGRARKLGRKTDSTSVAHAYHVTGGKRIHAGAAERPKPRTEAAADCDTCVQASTPPATGSKDASATVLPRSQDQRLRAGIRTLAALSTKSALSHQS